MLDRIIAHIDLDAFFASVEEQEKPYLKGMPIAVGADPLGGKGRGVVSTASYAARKYGIRSALPIQTAWKLSQAAKARGEQECIFIVPHHDKYVRVSQQVFAIIHDIFPVVEQVGVDEGYADATELGTFAAAESKAEMLRTRVRQELGLALTVGIGPNKLIAKLASEKGKPDGLCVVLPEEVDELLLPLSLQELPGIGKVTAARLLSKQLRTVRDARKLSWQELRKLFGSHGFSMYERLRGIDERTVDVVGEAPKSIGKHHTFYEDVGDIRQVEAVLATQVHSIMRSLKDDGFTSFRTVVLTVRFDDFSTVSRALTLSTPRVNAQELELKALKLLLPFFEKKENPEKKPIRLIGLRVEKLL
ncbi:MAG: DNA polymerase IV [Candidatus Pacebacteria bacterium]|nr:DNA polymerase IV [Candidatus Paceibacterota bacterium]